MGFQSVRPREYCACISRCKALFCAGSQVSSGDSDLRKDSQKGKAHQDSVASNIENRQLGNVLEIKRLLEDR